MGDNGSSNGTLLLTGRDVAELLTIDECMVDVVEQCAAIGELHHALDDGVITTADVYCELGEVIAGLKPGRTSAGEIIIFDSTGMALQDVITAAAVYEKAVREGVGLSIDFAPKQVIDKKGTTK